jgi:hypothetical protein
MKLSIMDRLKDFAIDTAMKQAIIKKLNEMENERINKSCIHKFSKIYGNATIAEQQKKK